MATRRGYYREELRRGIANIEMCLTHLARVVEAYEQDYPEIAKYIVDCGNALVAVAENIQSVHDEI